MAKFSNEDLTRWKREINPAPIITTRVPLQRENNEWVGLCPFHPDKNPSFKIWKLDEGVWGFKCFGCGENGNVFQFVQKFDKIPFTAAVKKVLVEAGVAGWTEGEVQADPEIPEQAPKENVTFPMGVYVSAVQALNQSPAGQEWLAKRGIGMAVARKFSVGFVQDASAISPHNLWMKDGWILFPTLSIDRTIVTAVKYRSLVAKKAKRGDGHENSGILRAPNTSTTLYNLLTADLSGDVWIVEGEPDTLVMAQAGLQVVGYPSASYRPTDEEVEMLSTAKRRFLAGDNDAAGIKTMGELQKRLRGLTYVIKWPNNRKDANDVLTNECGNDPKKFQALVEDLKNRATQTVPVSIIRDASDIPMKQIKWLWQDRIPLGKITLFAGNPDNGKSLASTSIAAHVSKGVPLPESHFAYPPSDVLMLIGEDDADDTAVPRLKAAGANLERIHFLEAVRKPQEENHEVRLDWDISAIDATLEANPKIRLLVIDPISNYLGEVNMIAEQEVRSILIPLKRVAERHNIAIVIVMHLNKKADLDAISRVGGAMAFIGVARCSWLFARNVVAETAEGEDVTPADKKNSDTFSMLRIKNNLVSASRAGLSYSVAVEKVEIEGEPVFIPYVQWGKVIEGSADEALLPGGRHQAEPGVARGMGRPSDKLQVAVKWLEDVLQDGLPHASRQLMSDARAVAGIAPETLRRAYDAIHGEKPTKSGAIWYWQASPMSGTTSDEDLMPQQSSLIEAEGNVE